VRVAPAGRTSRYVAERYIWVNYLAKSGNTNQSGEDQQRKNPNVSHGSLLVFLSETRLFRLLNSFLLPGSRSHFVSEQLSCQQYSDQKETPSALQHIGLASWFQ